MPARWKFFRVVCLLQVMLTVVFAVLALINLINNDQFYYLLPMVIYTMLTWLSVIGLSTLNNNYPDKPIAGTQKSVFNWVFLINFLLLIFLFGSVFTEYRDLQRIGSLINRPVHKFPISLLMVLLADVIILFFHMMILYGLYTMRREIYENFYMRQQFEFEKEGKEDQR